MLLICGKRKQKQFKKSNSCKNRHDTAVPSIEMYVCPGDTSVQILQKLKIFTSEARREPELLTNRIILASMFNDITSWESLAVQAKSFARAKESFHAARFRPGYWCFCGPGSAKTRQHNEERPSHQPADSEWDKLDVMAIRELTICKHPVFQCPNILETGALTKRQEGGGVGTHFRSEPDDHRILEIVILACNQLFFFLVAKIRSRGRDQCRFQPQFSN